MCVGVVENETGWGGYVGWDQIMKDFLCPTIEFVFIVCIGSAESCKDFSIKMMVADDSFWKDNYGNFVEHGLNW